jgi:hypothetical protein
MAVASEAKTLGSLGLGGVTRARWRSRARACRACPVFDRATHKCRDTAGRGLGCGCWMPAKSLVAEGACWYRKLGAKDYGFA